MLGLLASVWILEVLTDLMDLMEHAEHVVDGFRGDGLLMLHRRAKGHSLRDVGGIRPDAPENGCSGYMLISFFWRIFFVI